MIGIYHSYCSPDPNGLQYEQYCHINLMLHMLFRQLQHLLAGISTFTTAYAHFFCSGAVPSSLEDGIQHLKQQSIQSNEDSDDTNDQSDSQYTHPSASAQEDWMLLCQLHPAQIDSNSCFHIDVDWTEAAKVYPNIDEMATFVSWHKIQHYHSSSPTTANINNFKSSNIKLRPGV